MEKKEFQAESKRLLDLMIHSIYTHQEIFLREILSNASDAIDKLAYRALTDENVGLSRSDFVIRIEADKDARTLTVRAVCNSRRTLKTQRTRMRTSISSASSASASIRRSWWPTR